MNSFCLESYLDNPINSKYFKDECYNLFLKRAEFGIIPKQIYFNKFNENIFNYYNFKFHISFYDSKKI